MTMEKIEPDTKWLRDNPDYLDIMTQLIDYESNLEPQENDRILDHYNEENGTDYSVKWRNTDVPFNPSMLYQLEVHGFLERVFNSNSTTLYSIRRRDDMKGEVRQLQNQFNDGIQTVIHDFPSEDDLREMGIFDDVVGYEDIKFLFYRAMSAEDIINIVMFGPPGSAKTVFLMCINKLDDSCYVSGSPTSGPGFYDVMFDERPRYMAIDELDNMDSEHQKALSDYTDTGMLVETKGNSKKRRMRTNTKTFAAANRPGDILPEIENRFVDLHFEPYSYDEFIEVCEHIIPRNEGKSKPEARKIADAVWEFDGFGNVRKAIQASRLSQGDPEKIIGILDQYSGGGGLLEL